jgi:hypothetical protein
MLWLSESVVLNHSDTLIYLTICNAIKWWQLYPHTFNHVHLSALTLYLLKSYTFLLVLRALCPTVGLVLVSLLRSLVLPLWALCPLDYHLCGALCSLYGPCACQLIITIPSSFGLSVGLINELMPWYLNFGLPVGLVNCLTPWYVSFSSSVGLLNHWRLGT